MSEKIQKILEEIKLGIRKNTYDMEITADEYLSKDENDVVFLEHLFEYNILVNYKDEEKFKNNKEVAYVYCKNNKSLYPFDLNEEDLFSIINDKLFIEFIAEKGKLTKKIINNVKNHLELIDIIISINEFYYLEYLSAELAKKLIIKYPNGLYPIEKYLINERVYKYLIPLINDFSVLNEISTRYNKMDFLKYVNKDVLMNNLNENETVLHLLINNFNIVPELLKKLPIDMHFINFLRTNNFYKYLQTASEDIFLLKVESDKTLLEELLEKGYKPKMTGYLWEAETIKLLNDNSCLEMINEIQISERLLLELSKNVLKIDDGYNRTLLEYLLDNGYQPLKNCYYLTNVEIIKILFNKGYYKLLGEKLQEKELLIEIKPGISIIDKLLESNVNINVESFESIEIAKKLYSMNRFDLLAICNIGTLLNNCNENSTYFDFVLEGIKTRKIQYSLTKYKCSDKLFSKFYIAIARHDMMQYVDELDEKKLLTKYNEKTLLEELLDLDSNLTLNKVLTEKLKSNPKISIILKSRGINIQKVDVIADKPNFTKSYLDDINSNLGIGPLHSEGELLLMKLENLFISDGTSDPELVSALISGYKDALINNYEINIKELRRLVEIKEKNMETFFYIKEEDSGYFSSWTGCVYCDDTTMSTLLHETGHALHYYLTDEKVPEEYNDIVEKIRRNPQTINKVEGYSIKFNELRDKIKSSVEQKCEEYFKLHFKETEEDIIDFLNKSKEEKKEEFKGLGISEETLDIILEDVFTKEEYISHQKRIFIRENIDVILRSEFGAYISVGDIIDAIFDGDFRSGTLKNEKGMEIKSTFGHGIAYYFARDHGFDEMFANFCMILKSKDCNQILNLLKDILGDELYNMFSKFYYDNILNYNEIKIDEQKLL